MGMRRQTDRQTNTQTAVATIHFASATPHARTTSCRDVKEWSQNDACRSPMHGPEPDDGDVAVATTIMQTRWRVSVGRSRIANYPSRFLSIATAVVATDRVLYVSPRPRLSNSPISTPPVSSRVPCQTALRPSMNLVHDCRRRSRAG